jgi:hypothetical protein
MLFSFVGGDSICPGVALDYVPGGVRRGVMHGACCHLFVWQVYTSSFGTGWQGVMMQHKEAFCGLEVQDVSEFNSD